MRTPPLLVLALLLGSAATLAPGARACPDAPHAFRFADATLDAVETVGEVQIEVVRDGSDDCEASVLLLDEGGSATADDDYSAPTGPLVFAQGQGSMSLTVDIWADELEEGEETLVLSLASLIQDPGEIGEPDEVTITIVDEIEETCANTDSYVRFADATVSVDEDDGRAEVVVERVGPIDCEIEVEWSVSALTATVELDFLEDGGTLEMASGTQRRTLRIPIVDDSLDEPDERFRVEIDDVDGPNADVGEPDAATVTIEDDDLPPPPVVTPTPSTDGTITLVFEPASYTGAPLKGDGTPGEATLSLYNRGNATVTDVRFRTTGPFTPPSWSCFPLEPGEACGARATFSTSSSGVLEGSIVATHNGTDVASASLRVLVFTTGLVASPSSVDVGTAVADEWSPFVPLTLSNPEPFESGPLRITLNGALAANGTCTLGLSLPAGGSCTLLIALRSSSPGPQSTFFDVTAANFGTIRVGVVGEVVPYEWKPLVVEPAGFDFREQRTGTGMTNDLTIRNPNGRSVALHSTGATSPFFVNARIEFGECRHVSAMSTCRLPLGVKPPAPGEHRGEFFVNSSVGQVRGNLSVIGLPPGAEPRACFAGPTGGCDYDGMTLGTVTVGGEGVLRARLISDSGVETRLYEWRNSNPNFTYVHTCGATLAPKPAACDVVVTFRPTAAGVQRTLLEVWAAGGGWKLLAVSGEARASILADGAEAARIEPPKAGTPLPPALLLLAGGLAAAMVARRR